MTGRVATARRGPVGGRYRSHSEAERAHSRALNYDFAQLHRSTRVLIRHQYRLLRQDLNEVGARLCAIFAIQAAENEVWRRSVGPAPVVVDEMAP